MVTLTGSYLSRAHAWDQSVPLPDFVYLSAIPSVRHPPVFKITKLLWFPFAQGKNHCFHISACGADYWKSFQETIKRISFFTFLRCIFWLWSSSAAREKYTSQQTAHLISNDTNGIPLLLFYTVSWCFCDKQFLDLARLLITWDAWRSYVNLTEPTIAHRTYIFHCISTCEI